MGCKKETSRKDKEKAYGGTRWATAREVVGGGPAGKQGQKKGPLWKQKAV
jgi:hypothetical protein